jgi:DUF4097 and DUF4098 domain-containing protein YvlB
MRNLLLALSLGAAVVLSGCDMEDWGTSSDRFKEDFAHNYPMKSGGRLYLENFNGSVEVRGWEKDSIDITGTKYAATEDLLRELKIDIAHTDDSIRIRTIRPVDRRANCGARYIIRLPKNVTLDRVESSNGSLRADGITGNARLKTSNGSVNIYQLTGDVDVSTSNGSIEVAQFQGAAILRTSNASIKASGVRGAFEGATSNGSIDVTIAELDAGKPLRLDTSNASINFTLEKWKNNDIYADTSNSSINARLPEGVNAKLKATTSNGSVSSDLDVSVTSKGKTHLEGTIGSGGPAITLATTNGNVRLLKRL